MKIENTFLDLSKLSKEEIIEVYNILCNNGQNILKYTACKLQNGEYDHTCPHLSCHPYNDDIKWMGWRSLNSYKEFSLGELKNYFRKDTSKVGDTFEYNGYICEYKEKIEEEIWVLNTSTKAFIKVKKFYDFTHKEITDQEFIKQLEKYSK